VLRLELTLSVVVVGELNVVASLGHWWVRKGVINASVPQSFRVRIGCERCGDVDGVVGADGDFYVPFAANWARNDSSGGASSEGENGGSRETHGDDMKPKVGWYGIVV
jgi:hypothetical protein